MTAWAVIDAGPVCAGVTAYTTAKVTSLHGLIYADLVSRFGKETASAYAAANQSAIVTVAEFVERDGIDCDFERERAYTYTEERSSLADVEAEAEAAALLDLPAAFTTETELPYPVLGAVRFDDQAQFHPRRYCLGLADAIVAAGGSVHGYTRALEVDDDNDGVTVVTDAGRIRAGHVVLATHLPISDRGAFFARAHPYRSYALAVRVRGDRPAGMYLSAGTTTRSVRRAQPEWLIVGGEGHKVGQDPDTTQRYEALESWARERFDVVSIDHRWSAQDYSTLDGLPYVGPITPRAERILIATGFRKWGMTNGTAAASMLADRIAGRDNPWQFAFDSTRVKPRQSLSTLVKENANVAKRFIGDRLAHGDAPRCTHLGCVLTSNTAEGTWDCPCHGSRFDEHGRVIQGPAVKDLRLPQRG